MDCSRDEGIGFPDSANKIHGAKVNALYFGDDKFLET